MDTARGETVPSVDDSVTLVSRAREVPDVSYRAFLETTDGPRFHWADRDGMEISSGGACVRLTGSGPDRFDDVRREADALFSGTDVDAPAAARPRLFGGLSFFPDHQPAEPWAGFPAAEFVLPRVQLTRAHGSTWLTINACAEGADPAPVETDLDDVAERVADLPAMRPTADPPVITDRDRVVSWDEYVESVDRATDRIRSGDFRKVVLATALAADLAEPVDATELVERLRRTYPECYRFLVQPDDGGAFFGAPPERLVRLDGRTARTEALAGSVGRGETPSEDDALASSLLESEKLQHEQGLVLDAIREQLATFGDVDRGEQGVKTLATIQHLHTPVTVELDRNEHVLTLVDALHPTPAVGGMPPADAADAIRETEPFHRGWYASPVGWFDADGDGEFAVGIRSGVAADDRVTLFAGNGIVADSDPEAEWDEVQLKFRPILDELQ
ncbi:MAG TPA: isochorismate synthase [Natrialbaceae archaeon]|nr:isochorismate synthase [Natrialbaceae archaeon]